MEKRVLQTNEFFVNRAEYPSFWQNALAIKGSVTPKVANRVAIIFFYSCCFSLMQYFGFKLSIPIGPFEYAGLIMGLILVFRINSGYDRWWEARKLWGTIVNQTRNLAIVIIKYANCENKRKVELLNQLSALPYLMRNHVRQELSFTEVTSLLECAELKSVQQAEHPPAVLSSFIAEQLEFLHKNKQLNEFMFLRAEEHRAEILNCQGACERILKTPMPFVMAVKSRRFIFLFLLALPLALVNISLLYTPIISGLVAYTLFSLDQIGIELQNPFSEKNLSHLPLLEICSTIEKNLKELSLLLK